MNYTTFFDQVIQDNPVVLFIKGTQDMPMCGFSSAVLQVFNTLGIAYKTVNVLEDFELKEALKEYSNWPTIPQIYIKGELIGGCDIIREMFKAHELEPLLKEKGILPSEQGAEIHGSV